MNTDNQTTAALLAQLKPMGYSAYGTRRRTARDLVADVAGRNEQAVCRQDPGIKLANALHGLETEVPATLDGQVIVVTGEARHYERDTVFMLIEHWGGEVRTAVSRRTTLLLYGDTGKFGATGKAKKARDLGVPVVQVDRFMEYYGDDSLKTTADFSKRRGAFWRGFTDRRPPALKQ